MVERACSADDEAPVDVLKIRDFTHTCISYVKEIMNMEQLIIKEWEAFLPEAKAIAL